MATVRIGLESEQCRLVREGVEQAARTILDREVMAAFAQLGQSMASFGAAISTSGEAARIGWRAIADANRVEANYTHQLSIPLRWYSCHDPLRNEFILGLRDESTNITCEQRIAEELLRRGRWRNEESRATDWLGERLLLHLREAGIPPERIEQYRQFIVAHVNRGFLWGTPRQSRDEVSLCTCSVCEREHYQRRDTRQLPAERPYPADWDWQHQYSGYIDRRINEEGKPYYTGCGCPYCLDSKEKSQEDANARARSLLLSCLSPFQRQRFNSDGWFIVVAQSGRQYRIEKGYNFNIAVLDKKGQRMIGLLCAGPYGDVPVYDSMLAQKLWLENDEEGFLKVANQDGFIDEPPIPTNTIRYGGARQGLGRW